MLQWITYPNATLAVTHSAPLEFLKRWHNLFLPLIAIGLSLPQEEGFELYHPWVNEQQRGILRRRQDRRGFHHYVVLLHKVLDEGVPYASIRPEWIAFILRQIIFQFVHYLFVFHFDLYDNYFVLIFVGVSRGVIMIPHHRPTIIYTRRTCWEVSHKPSTRLLPSSSTAPSCSPLPRKNKEGKRQEKKTGARTRRHREKHAIMLRQQVNWT